MNKDKPKTYLATLKIDIYSQPYSKKDLVGWLEIFNSVHSGKKSGMRIKIVTFKKQDKTI